MILKIGQFVQYKTMADGSLRLTLDLGEVSPEVMEEMHRLRVGVNTGIVLASEEDFTKLIDHLNGVNEDSH